MDSCSECGKPNVRCKGLCPACYSRLYRKTPTGKAGMNQYNSTKGKLAREKMRSKRRSVKPPKPQKPLCECGAMSKINGFCLKCYHKHYQRKLNALNPPKEPKTPKINIDEVFKMVLKEVGKGKTISKACQIIKIHSSILYTKITPAQKAELIAAKTIGPIIEDY
jgi:hypothetical protein